MEQVCRDYREADIDPPVRVLCELAEQLTRKPWTVDQEHIDRVRAHGWSDAAVHDAIQVISYFNYINRVADGVGIEDEPEWEADGRPR